MDGRLEAEADYGHRFGAPGFKLRYVPLPCGRHEVEQIDAVAEAAARPVLPGDVVIETHYRDARVANRLERLAMTVVCIGDIHQVRPHLGDQPQKLPVPLQLDYRLQKKAAQSPAPLITPIREHAGVVQKANGGAALLERPGDIQGVRARRVLTGEYDADPGSLLRHARALRAA